MGVYDLEMIYIATLWHSGVAGIIMKQDHLNLILAEQEDCKTEDTVEPINGEKTIVNIRHNNCRLLLSILLEIFRWILW